MKKHVTTKNAAKLKGIGYLYSAGLYNMQIDKLVGMGYFTQPASKGHHLAEVGGLVKHSVNVTSRLVQFTKALGVRWSRKESPYLVGMLHDLVKCRCYQAVPVAGCSEPKWEYIQPVYPGHGVCSIAIAEELRIRLMRDEIAAIIYHMGMFGVGKEYTDNEFYTAMNAYAPQILATHCADWYASAVDENQKGETK